MSHIRPVPLPQGGFGGLSPPNNAPSPQIEIWKLWISVVLPIFTMWRYQQGNKKLTPTITWGDLHLGTAWPPLLSGWKSPGAGIPGVWVIFAENLKVINAGMCSHRWHWQLAREPRFVLFWWWTGSTALSGLKVHVLNKVLWSFTTSARTTRSKPFFG